MSAQRSHNTEIERRLRSELHRRGLRFRVHKRLLAQVRREADIVFPSARLAVFVDGCFWHACPVHATWPKSNAEWWRAKIQGNVARDRDTDSRLREAGWTVLRVWEHADVEEAANQVQRLLTQLRR